MGIAEFDEQMQSAEDLVVKADKALYEAKNKGRNQLFCWSRNKLVRTPNSPKKRLKKPANAR